VFDGFTNRARRVLALAQDEAWLLGHHFVGPEHILLGLLREGDGLAAQALASFGASLETARQKVHETVDPLECAPAGHPYTFNFEAKKLLEKSLRERLELGHGAIDAEHMLLGLTRRGESKAVEVLAGLGISVDQVRQTVVSLMSQPRYVPSVEGAAVGGGSTEPAT
jgi:ATP-dependent Clp protease ATP-binding subunit ClpC